MLPRVSPLFFLATAVGLLAVHSCIMVGGALREASIAFCAFCLLIGAPIAILAWFGSLTDMEEKSRQRRREHKRQKSEAVLWQRTLLDLQASARGSFAAGGPNSPHQVIINDVASAPVSRRRQGWAAKSRIWARVAAVASTLGLMGCFPGTPAANWAMVHPGMGTAELISLVGAPEQIRSDGMTAVWQYCRDFFGRNADYYMAVLVDGETVRNVRPYPVYSDAGCQDFYRSDF